MVPDYSSKELRDYATQFCYWFYQSRRGKILVDHPELLTAIDTFIDLFEDMSRTDQTKLRNALHELIKQNNCLERFKQTWINIGNHIIEIFNEFREDVTITLSEDEREAIIYRCEPTFLTATIQYDEHALEVFIKSYYDLGKQKVENESISNYIPNKEEFVIKIIRDYLKIHTNPNTEYVIYGYIAPKKKDIAHLIRLYLTQYALQGEKSKNDEAILHRMQPIFKHIFSNPNLQLSKADKPERKNHLPSNEYEL